MKAEYFQYQLQFKFAAGTSRGVLHEKETWFISLCDEVNPSVKGWGECALFRGLSIDDREGYAEKMKEVCDDPVRFTSDSSTLLVEWPSIRFGLETALADLNQGGQKILYPTSFTRGEDSIRINGFGYSSKVK